MKKIETRTGANIKAPELAKGKLAELLGGLIMKPKILLTIVAGALAVVPTALVAQNASTTGDQTAEATTPMAAPLPAPDESPWRFGVTVPLWAPQINGNVTIKGHQQNVDVSFDQLKDHLDAAFSLALEARTEKFGFYADVGYMKFSGGKRGLVR